MAEKLDPNFHAADSLGGSCIEDATRRANGWICTGANFDFASKPLKQRDASAMVDRKVLGRLEADWQNEVFFTAHLNLATEVGAGAFLMAAPVDDARKCCPKTFRVMLKRRLKIIVLAKLQGYPYCDEIMDIYRDHAISGMGRPHRNRRQNKIRDALYRDLK